MGLYQYHRKAGKTACLQLAGGRVERRVTRVMVRARRMEETSAWQHPVDLPALLRDVHDQLNAAIGG